MREADLAFSDVVLDIGCGRGELVMHCSSHGVFSVGVDYSASAIRIAKETAVAFPAHDRSVAYFVLADAGCMPFRSNVFSVIFLMDIVEHLYPYYLKKALGEGFRVLKPNGRLVIHTGPNALIMKLGVPILRLLALLLDRTILGISYKTKNPRKGHARYLHVNEQTPVGLKRNLRGIGFAQIKVIVKGIERETQLEKALRSYLPFSLKLAKILVKSPLGLFAENGFWAIASKEN